MPGKKRRFYRLLEQYMNEYRKDAVELIYGVGSKIKVHHWSYNSKGDTFLFELVVILGDEINESVMDKSLAVALLNDSLVYFYPEVKNIRCIVSFDV